MATVDQNKNVVPEDETTHPGGKPTDEQLQAQAYLPPPRDHEGLTPQGVGVFLPGSLEPRTPGVGGTVPGLGHVDPGDTSYQQIANKQRDMPEEDRPTTDDVLPSERLAAREQAEDVAKSASGQAVEAVTVDDPRTGAVAPHAHGRGGVIASGDAKADQPKAPDARAGAPDPSARDAKPAPKSDKR